MAITPSTAPVGEGVSVALFVTYLTLAALVVVYLARTLYRRGALFLEQTFEDPKVAEAVNHLLVIGFYLLNLGYAFISYRLRARYDSLSTGVGELVQRFGMLMLTLGFVHLCNVFVFWRIRTYRERQTQRRAPRVTYAPRPAAPQQWGAPQ